MEPVRKLRRICSILHVTDKDGNAIVMRPQQLLQYLINNNIALAKSELASIFSRLKSFVALGTGKHRKRDIVAGTASETCQNVLNWSKDYQNEPTMYVFRISHSSDESVFDLLSNLPTGLSRCCRLKWLTSWLWSKNRITQALWIWSQSKKNSTAANWTLLTISKQIVKIISRNSANSNLISKTIASNGHTKYCLIIRQNCNCFAR